MLRTRIVVALVLSILALVIVLQNTAPVETTVLFFSVTMPRALLLFLTWLVGVVTGLLIALAAQRKRKPGRPPTGPPPQPAG